MSNGKEYAYTFRMIVPDKTHEELLDIRKKMEGKSEENNYYMHITTLEDYMTVSVKEKTEFPDGRLQLAIMMTKTALQECGIINPIFISAYATPTENKNARQAHLDTLTGEPNDQRIDLTDEMFSEEIAG
jgi:hypothetical protein